MFGVYDLALPPKLQAKLRVGRASGPAGVFAMGAVSGVVASPCVSAPLLAVLAWMSTTGDVVLGAALLFTMSWGMSALLILAGTFSGFIGRLPKAGGWMAAVKTAMGVILLLAALYYLRPVMPLDAFGWMAAAPAGALGLALTALSRGGPRSPRWKRALRAAGVTALVLGLYLGLGALFRAGLPAPGVIALYPAEVEGSHSLVGFREDHVEALAEAEAEEKPVMVFFSLPNCEGCRELDRDVFSQEEVAREAGRFVSIHVDLAEENVRDLARRLRADKAPTVAWIDSAGGERYGLTLEGSDITPGDFVELMRQVD
jgi:thiol:disulfide interchange protein DsbD